MRELFGIVKLWEALLCVVCVDVETKSNHCCQFFCFVIETHISVLSPNLLHQLAYISSLLVFFFGPKNGQKGPSEKDTSTLSASTSFPGLKIFYFTLFQFLSKLFSFILLLKVYTCTNVCTHTYMYIHTYMHTSHNIHTYTCMCTTCTLSVHVDDVVMCTDFFPHTIKLRRRM